MRFIRSDEDLDWHIGSLTQAHPMFESLRHAAGAVPVRWLDRGFKGLVFVVTGQQISVAAGRAIYGRLEAALGDITAETVAAASDDVLRAAGFSAPKIRTLRALQEAAIAGNLDLDALEEKERGGSDPFAVRHQGDRPLDRRGLPALRRRSPRHFPRGRRGAARVGPARLCARHTPGDPGPAGDVRCVVALAERRGAASVGLLPREEGRQNRHAGIGLRFLSGASPAAGA